MPSSWVSLNPGRDWRVEAGSKKQEARTLQCSINAVLPFFEELMGEMLAGCSKIYSVSPIYLDPREDICCEIVFL
jgi:hypothetical protein